MPERADSSQRARQPGSLCPGSYRRYIAIAVTKRGDDGEALRAVCPECDKAVAINKANGILRAHRG